MKRTPVLAKLSPPRLARVYLRRRLFARLDQARECPVVWISAPAGAGKTTSVASYLKDRGLHCIWYQMDTGDSDPASLFYYLGQAAPRRNRPLPLLTPEFLPNLAVFTRNFFRALFARLNVPAVLVLDNYQEVPEGAPLHEVLALGLREIPAGITVLILSRSDPPVPFASLRASEALAMVSWEELRLNKTESKGVVLLRNAKLSAVAMSTLIEQSHGWMAGLVLLLEQRRVSPEPRVSGNMRDYALLFAYFATELFDRIEPDIQELLLKTAFLPQIATYAAVELTNNPHAEDILSDLVRRNFFTYQHADGSYIYHPLLRDFLRHRAERNIAPDALRALHSRSAALLRVQGDVEAAIGLLHTTRDWPALAQLVLQEAPRLAATGRFATIERATTPLPETVLAQTPWSRYWLAVCRSLANPIEAIPLFEAAYAQFERVGDVPGLYLTWAGVIDAIVYSLRDFRQLDAWLERLDRLTETYPEFPSVEVEARVIAAALAAITWRRPAHSGVPRLRERALDLLQRSSDVAVTTRLGFHLFWYMYWFDTADAEIERILSRLTQSDNTLGGFLFERILTRQAWNLHHAARCAAGPALVAVEEALNIAEHGGVHMMDCMLIGIGVGACFGAGDLEQGSELLERLEEKVRLAGSKLDHSLCRHLRGWRSALLGDFPAALRETEQAMRSDRELGAMPQDMLATSCLAQYQLAGGDADAARATLASLEEIPGLDSGFHWSFDRFLATAAIALASRDEAGAREAVSQVMRLARRSGYMTGIGTLRTLLAQACAFALEYNIDPDSARTLIQRCRLTPPRDTLVMERWPYPLKLYTFGRFEIVINGKPLRFQGKIQRRPLDLLAALIALGGRGGTVSVARLAEELWPDAEADAAHAACKSALGRLRHLLGDNDILPLSDHHLTLNPDKVWVDAWAFERTLAGTETSAVGSAEAETSRADTLHPLALYRGPFLKDIDSSWAISVREQLRAKFLRLLTSSTRSHMHGGRYEAALPLLNQGLESEPLAEELYRDLMRCHSALDRRAEALVVYQRCHKLLISQVGLEPGPGTQALYRAIRDNQPLPL